MWSDAKHEAAPQPANNRREKEQTKSFGQENESPLCWITKIRFELFLE